MIGGEIVVFLSPLIVRLPIRGGRLAPVMFSESQRKIVLGGLFAE